MRSPQFRAQVWRSIYQASRTARSSLGLTWSDWCSSPVAWSPSPLWRTPGCGSSVSAGWNSLATASTLRTAPCSLPSAQAYSLAANSVFWGQPCPASESANCSYFGRSSDSKSYSRYLSRDPQLRGHCWPPERFWRNCVCPAGTCIEQKCFHSSRDSCSWCGTLHCAADFVSLTAPQFGVATEIYFSPWSCLRSGEGWCFGHWYFPCWGGIDHAALVDPESWPCGFQFGLASEVVQLSYCGAVCARFVGLGSGAVFVWSHLLRCLAFAASRVVGSGED